MRISQSLLIAAMTLILAGLFSCDNNTEDGDSNATNEPTAKEQEPQRENSGERLSPPDTAKISFNGWEMTVRYGSPSVRDRDIWGALVPYDKVWRTGANEATIFQTNRPVTVLGKELPAGKYALFTIPGTTSWVVIFNEVWNQWGAYEYNENEDALRVVVNPQRINTFTERLTFDFEKKGDESARLRFMWENLQFALPIAKSK
jgi:hypothetical protein